MSELRPVGQQPEAPTGDIVFVHGLGGHLRETWMAEPRDDATFWPLWLARDLPTCRTWSLDYEADLSKWGGSVMNVDEHADTILEILKTRGVGTRPVVFLVHSLGGLVTKALLRTALDSKAESYRRIAEQTRGIVFFATPNSGAKLASLAASLLWFLRPSPVLKDLRAHGSALRKLNTWYRDQVTDGALGGREGVRVFYEKAGIFRAPFLIVDETSADPGIPDVKPLALTADHWATCKLTEVNGWLYASVRDHARDALARPAPTDRPVAPSPANAPPVHVQQIDQSGTGNVAVQAKDSTVTITKVEASGPGAIAIGGGVKDSTIIAGSNNRVSGSGRPPR